MWFAPLIGMPVMFFALVMSVMTGRRIERTLKREIASLNGLVDSLQRLNDAREVQIEAMDRTINAQVEHIALLQGRAA